MDPVQYDAWYATPRGRWIAAQESALLWRLMGAHGGESLLGVGCGTEQFSRRFAAAGLQVVGVDTDQAALAYARWRSDLPYVCADARSLPVASRSFDWVSAVTSLCFVHPPSGGWAARRLERVAPARLNMSGFLAAVIEKPR